MAGNWKDSETKALLSIRSEEEIIRQLNGTVRDAVVYERITQKLRERGVLREKTQVINKLKTLRKKFYQINQRDDQLGKSDWPYFDMCHYIWGGGHTATPVLLNPLEPYPPDNDAETTLSDSDILKTEVCTEFVPLSPAESPLSPQSPPNKSAKKVSRGEQMVKDMKEFFTEMDKDFEERERFRHLEQRQYEECLRKEAKEEERDERARQMAMFKELLESQNNLLRELLWRIPSKNNDEPVTTSSVANNPGAKECMKYVHDNHAESLQSPSHKRVKKVLQEEQIAKDMKESFTEIARTLEERERLRLLEQRQHEDRLRKEAKEEAREERARQMAMFKEMQESQNSLLKELVRRMPSPTRQQFNSSKYCHSINGNQSRFNTECCIYAGNSTVKNTSNQDDL